MVNETVSLLRSFISSRTVISFEYNGGRRTVEPYCLGINHKGNTVLRAYQLEGYSETNTPTGWKMFLVPSINLIEFSFQSFQIRSQYNPNDKAMVEILERV